MGSECPYGVRLRASVALCDLELHPLPLFEATETIRLDGRIVHEDVTAAVDRDESITLVRVEPLDSSLSHSNHRYGVATAGREVCAGLTPVSRGPVTVTALTVAITADLTTAAIAGTAFIEE
jgi:hypothetical protein